MIALINKSAGGLVERAYVPGPIDVGALWAWPPPRASRTPGSYIYIVVVGRRSCAGCNACAHGVVGSSHTLVTVRQSVSVSLLLLNDALPPPPAARYIFGSQSWCVRFCVDCPLKIYSLRFLLWEFMWAQD